MTDEQLAELAAALMQPATADLKPCRSLAAVAAADGGWSEAGYSAALANAISSSNVPLDVQRERLAALACLGDGLGDQVTAGTIAAHSLILEALFHRFAKTAHDIHAESPVRNSGPAVAYLAGAVKAQRAAMACLSALKVLRDGNQPPTTAAHESIPAPAKTN